MGKTIGVLISESFFDSLEKSNFIDYCKEYKKQFKEYQIGKENWDELQESRKKIIEELNNQVKKLDRNLEMIEYDLILPF